MNVRHKMLQVYTFWSILPFMFYVYSVYNLLIFIVSIVQVLPLQLLKDSYRVSQDCRMVKGN